MEWVWASRCAVGMRRRWSYHRVVRTLVRPRWIAGHALVIAAVVMFVLAGFWQLRRHDERTAFNAAVEAGLSSDAIQLRPQGDALPEPYRRVEIVGEYDAALQALQLRARRGASGYRVLTPLGLDGGGAILVERGWVPITVDSPARAEIAPPIGTIRVRGQLWPAPPASSTDALREIVRRPSPAIFEAASDDVFVPGVFVVLDDQQPAIGAESLPIPSDPPELSAGPHLGYAGQWFLFTLVVLVGYPILLRRVARRNAAFRQDVGASPAPGS